MIFGRQIRVVLEKARGRRRRLLRARLLKEFQRSGRRPWAPGYLVYREDLIRECIHDGDLAVAFANGTTLPAGYGYAVDERIIEYPWLASVTGSEPARALDAGSALNHGFLLDSPPFSSKDLHIVTLAPEPTQYVRRGVSYLFCDLRNLPYRDGWFDEVYSISTLEHVGMDNSLYVPDGVRTELDPRGFLDAVREIVRITRAGGKIALTVPFGKYTNFHWYQQFDAALLDVMIAAFNPRKVRETIYRYTSEGWSRSTRAECVDVEGFDIQNTKYFNPASTRGLDPDNAAGSRAVAALEIWI